MSESRPLEIKLFNGQRELAQAIVPWWGRLRKLSKGSAEEKKALKVIYLYSFDREYEVKRTEEYVAIVNTLVDWEFFSPETRKPLGIVKNIMQSCALFIGEEVHLEGPYPDFKADQERYEKLSEYREIISTSDRVIPGEAPTLEKFQPNWKLKEDPPKQIR
jgi:hypothetical protein